MYKYKIIEFLDNLPTRQNKLLTKEIHKVLGISRNTFRNYSLIPFGHKSDIPYCVVIKIEILFGMKSGELINREIKGQHYMEVITKTGITLATLRKQKSPGKNVA